MPLPGITYSRSVVVHSHSLLLDRGYLFFANPNGLATLLSSTLSVDGLRPILSRAWDGVTTLMRTTVLHRARCELARILAEVELAGLIPTGNSGNRSAIQPITLF